MRSGARTTILRLIEEAADAGRRSPTNLDIADAVGFQSNASASRLLQMMQDEGLIRVESGSSSRVITIVASGKRTAGRVTKPHWRLTKKPRPSAPKPVQPAPVEHLPPRVDRSVCPRCGARSDAGCRHITPALQMWGLGA